MAHRTRALGVDPRGLAPKVFVDPAAPLWHAVLTNYEPPPDLRERYLRGDERAAREVYEAALRAKDSSVPFEVGELLRELHNAVAKARRDKAQPSHCLSRVLSRLAERGRVRLVDARVSELVVHPYNARFVLHDEAMAGNFVPLVASGAILHPLLVVRVDDPALAEVHVAIFRMILERARRAAERDEALRKLIDSSGYEAVLRAFTGSRVLRLEGGRLVFAEDDRLRTITGIEEPRYFVIDGQLRALAMLEDFIRGYEKREYDRGGDDVLVQVVDGADPLTVSFLTFALNMGSRELVSEDFRSYGVIFGAEYAKTLKIVNDSVGSIYMDRAALSMMAASRAEQVESQDYTSAVALYLERESPPRTYRLYDDYDDKAEPPRAEPPRESRASPGLPGGGPVEVGSEAGSRPAWLVAPPQPLEQAQKEAPPAEHEVLRELLHTWLGTESLRQLFVLPAGVLVQLGANVRKELELLGEKEKRWEPDIRYIKLERSLEVQGSRLKAYLVAPLAWNMTCPSCRSPVLLGPMRCLFCGEVLPKKSSPLPYHFSHELLK